MLRYHVLASGSSGNMTLVQTDQVNVLVDCGLSLRKTLEKLNSCGLGLESIDAVLITHSHFDHMRSASVLSKCVKICLTKKLFDKIDSSDFTKKNCLFFRSGEAFWIKNLRIMPVPVCHDCVDPVCFVFDSHFEKLSVITDLGSVDDRLIAEVRGSQRILIEANYSLPLLAKSRRPSFLKNRILSRNGHLSNSDTAQFLKATHSDQLEEIVLLHLSQECNTPSLALSRIKKELKKNRLILPSIQVASAEGIPSMFKWL